MKTLIFALLVTMNINAYAYAEANSNEEIIDSIQEMNEMATQVSHLVASNKCSEAQALLEQIDSYYSWILDIEYLSENLWFEATTHSDFAENTFNARCDYAY